MKLVFCLLAKPAGERSMLKSCELAPEGFEALAERTNAAQDEQFGPNWFCQQFGGTAMLLFRYLLHRLLFNITLANPLLIQVIIDSNQPTKPDTLQVLGIGLIAHYNL